MNKERRKMEPYSVPMLWTVCVSSHRNVFAVSRGSTEGYSETTGAWGTDGSTESFGTDTGSWE